MKIINNHVLLTPREAAQMLGVSKRTIHRWCSTGFTHDRRPADPPDLKPFRGPNGRLYFNEQHIKSVAASYFSSPKASVTPPIRAG